MQKKQTTILMMLLLLGSTLLLPQGMQASPLATESSSKLGVQTKDERASLEALSETGEYPPTRGRAQRVAVTGKLWLLQSPHEPVNVAVKSAMSVSVPV